MRHTILVVDDEPDVVKSVKDLLRLEYRVLGATSPSEALQVLGREVVHVVMTDQRMPEMTGVEFLSKLRGDHPDAMRLLFTGYADIKAVVDAINHGNVYRYITKPWDPDELQAVIRQACERYDLLLEKKRLLSMLQAQNQDLEQANANLRRANELKHAFIQVASHELRTPLAILQGLTRLATNLPQAPEPLRSFVVRIDRASKRLNHLVEQLIAMLQAGRFEQTVDARPHDLSALLREATDDVRPFIELRSQTLTVDVPDDLGNIEVEAAKIRDSLNHLLLNAIKFTPDSGRIGVWARRLENGGAQISISDTGSGISPVMRERLFEPFFTGYDVSRHSSGTFEHGRQGLGLGLALVKAFIELHGGTVMVESEPGKGTIFTLTLPPAPPGPAPARLNEPT
jgi:signal transduction histidine kinase